ncbi:hydrogenase [Acidobacteria bacterium ACD]|nr:MAG: hydrogenase [Acidobacteriota bacterium]MCE7957820.1 hydrogenase [Acidobacteria bacterium ACB2]MDL1949425.1 hydrogenase [Acidobacteria bacterium ACD]
MLDTFLHALVLVLLPPLLPGIVNKTKAVFAGRTGPPVLQLYYDLAKLYRKGTVLSRTTTWVFWAGPVAGVVTALLAGLLVPLGEARAPVAFRGDFVLFAYLLALGRFFTAAAALDTGSAFEGMGAAREVSFSPLAEPALFFGFLAAARVSGSLSLSGLLTGAWITGWFTSGGALLLVLVAWFVVLLAETSRIPFDDPNTHLELTMIHEAMVLDHSGPLLGLVLYGASVKLLVLGTLLVRLALPVPSAGPLLGWALLLAGLVALSVAVGVVESVMARLRLVRVPQLLVTACLLSALGTVLVMR